MSSIFELVEFRFNLRKFFSNTRVKSPGYGPFFWHLAEEVLFVAHISGGFVFIMVGVCKILLFLSAVLTERHAQMHLSLKSFSKHVFTSSRVFTNNYYWTRMEITNILIYLNTAQPLNESNLHVIRHFYRFHK